LKINDLVKTQTAMIRATLSIDIKQREGGSNQKVRGEGKYVTDVEMKKEM